MAYLRALCILTGFALHVVPLYTVREVHRSGSTLNYHISTYAFALLNQSVNLWYALVRADPALTAHRFFGVLFNAYYAYTFLRYCGAGRTPEFRRTLGRAAALFGVVVVDLHVLQPLMGGTHASYFTHIAFFGAMTGIGLAAGPLATIVRRGRGAQRRTGWLAVGGSYADLRRRRGAALTHLLTCGR